MPGGSTLTAGSLSKARHSPSKPPSNICRRSLCVDRSCKITVRVGQKTERRVTMSELNVIRGWKDARYRRSLSAAELARLPENPAGRVELRDGELRKAGGFGGGGALLQTTAITCTATLGGCCPSTEKPSCPPGTTAATCTATFGGCCPEF